MAALDAGRAVGRSRPTVADILREGFAGLRSRRARAALSALGIGIGIASMVAVLGISDSSKASLLATLDRLGTNFLAVTPGQSFTGGSAEIPASAAATVENVPGVIRSSATISVSEVTVRRNDFVEEEQTGGIGVEATTPGLLETVGGSVDQGRFLTPGSNRLPTVVLGSTAAERLGIERLSPNTQIYVSGRWLTVIGILDPLELVPDLDSAALIGTGLARELFEAAERPSRIFVRTVPEQLDAVRELLPRAASPQSPEQIEVSRPSDAIEAQAAAKSAFTALFLGLGAVALLVGGVGIANVMVIAVLERRSEIGLRRALGATSPEIALQFLSEALLLSAAGGAGGACLGALVTALYAGSRDWPVAISPLTVAGGIGSALLIGALAGLYPAIRASRLSPTDALRSV